MDALSSVELNTLNTKSFDWSTILVLNDILAHNEEALSMALLEVFPELARVNSSLDFGLAEIVLLSNTAGHVDECLANLTLIQNFVITVEFGVGFFDQRHPELLRFSAVAVQRSLSRHIVGNSSVDSNDLPPSVLEELENGEAIFNSIMNNQIFEQLRVHSHGRECTKKPLVIQDTALDVAGVLEGLHHEGSVRSEDLFRASPFNDRDVLSVIWGIQGINIEGLVVGIEFRIAPLGSLTALLDLTNDSVNFFHDSVIARSTVHLITFIHHLLTFLIFIVVLLLTILLLLL